MRKHRKGSSVQVSSRKSVARYGLWVFRVGVLLHLVYRVIDLQRWYFHPAGVPDLFWLVCVTSALWLAAEYADTVLARLDELAANKGA